MPKKPPKMDRKLIALSQDHERAYWRKRLGVNLTQIRAAVKAVGPSVRKVREYLNAKT